MNRYIIGGIIAASLIISYSSHAHASGGVWCQSADKQAQISISLGRVPIYAPLNADAQLGQKRWHTDPQDGETVLGSSQGFIENDRLWVDFTDENVERIIISLRVDYSGKDTEQGYPGTLTFAGNKPLDVMCEFE